MADDLSDEARSAVEADWASHELALGHPAGSRKAIERAIEHGRALAALPAAELAPEVSSELSRFLRDAVQRMQGIEWVDGASGDPLTDSDEWHLVEAVVCGAGPPLDHGRQRGEDYAYARMPVREGVPLPTSLKTVSWDRETVVYRLEGLPTEGRLRLRALYGVDAGRTLKLAVDGQPLHEVSVQSGRAAERIELLPPESHADGELEISVSHLAGANAVVSALEVWSDLDPEGVDRDRLLACREITGWQGAGVPEDALALYHEIRWRNRDALLGRTAADVDELLYVARHWPSGNHQCAHRVGEHQIRGADLRVLAELSPDAASRTLLPPSMAGVGGIGRPDLSFDAQRVTFPYARPREPSTPYRWAEGHALYDPFRPADSSGYRGGDCHMYDIHEVDLATGRVHQLTDRPGSEDTEPCYLPDGRIAFTSSRAGRLVQCGDWALVFGLWAMNADGSDPLPLTQPQDTEFYPSVLPDGRILYTRWDYVMKPYNALQQLWAVNADGTGASLVYGDWFRFSLGPIALQEARAIPGTSKVVAIGAAHHNTGVGPLMVADLALHRAGPEGMVNLTPEVGYPECGGLRDEREIVIPGDTPPISNVENPAGWYASPWPLAEDLFLLSYSPDPYNASRTGYGIYLYSDLGQRELIHQLDDLSCYAPIPLRPRTPPQMAPRPEAPARGEPGTLYVQNVYEGLDGVEKGSVRWLRVLETYPKERHTKPHRVDVGVGSGWDMRGVLGLVPVEDDGSAYFRVPADRMIFLEALDEQYLEVQRMRNYIDLRPGESRSCVGCHEQPSTTAQTGSSIALGRPPSAIQPPPWGAGPFRFDEIVQPVLDRSCVPCHDGGDDAPFSLAGEPMRVAPHAGDADEGPQHWVSQSFLNLLPHVSYEKLTGHGGRKLPLPPRAVGSGASPLMEMLAEGHGGVELPLDDWRALAAWIDCNAPYYGSYDDEIVIAQP
jgi:hypothetical protein